MLTLTPADPPPYYRYQYVEKKVGGEMVLTCRRMAIQYTPEEMLLEPYRKHVEGSVFYGTDRRHDYLLEREKPIFLSETPPSGYKFVIEFPISTVLLHFEPEFLESLRQKLNAKTFTHLAERLSKAGCPGWYCNSQVMLTPNVPLKMSPSYRAYLDGGATLLPETQFTDYR